MQETAMFKDTKGESSKGASLSIFPVKIAMEGSKPNRPGSSKGKPKKQLQPKRPSNTPYMADSLILPRVKQYLEEHKHPGAGIVDIDEMVDGLRARYPEYGRRKRAPFRQGVQNAFDSIIKACDIASDLSDWGITSDLSDISSASDKDDEDMDEEMECNRGNDQIVNMYLRQTAQQQQQLQLHKRKRSRSDEAEKELINISSDEEIIKKDDIQKPQNGPGGIDDMNMNATGTTKAPPGQTVVATPQGIRITLPHGVQMKPTPVQKKSEAASSTPMTSATPKRRKKWKEIEIRKPSASFKDFGGSSKAIEEVCKLLVHVRHPEVYNHIGITPPRGFLLHGPPGSGKTLLAHAIAGELGIPMMTVAGPELVAGVSGESEERIREMFDQAAENAPCILFMDEIDAIAPSRHTAQKEMERRIVAQFLSCFDDLGRKDGGDLVVVIGATNRPDSLDPALRRAGRFDREVSLGIPDKEARIQILKILCKDLELAEDFDYDYIAKNTPGFVGADLMALTREASMVAVNRVFGSLKQKSKETQSLKKSQEIKEAVDDAMEEESSKDVDKSKKIQSESKEPSSESEEKLTENVEKQNDSEEKPSTTKEELSKNEDETPMDEDPPPAIEKLPEKATPAQSLNNEVTDLITWLREDHGPLSTEQLNQIHIELNDFKTALKSVQPSAKREGFATVPDVTWDDVGSLNDIREELQMTIMAPVRFPERFAELGISTPSGVLLCGPPGCGKTLLAKAVANEAGINFISVKGPELLNMYVGESEKAVRQCFQRARNSAPCVIFFDELDALCPKRTDSGEGGASMRVVNQMLTEMDGIECRKGVFLMAASNRPEIVDPAVLRPGRLDKILYIGLPSPSDRVDILKALTKNGTRPLLDEDVKLAALAGSNDCSGYTGADLAALVREAGLQALKETIDDSKDAQKLTVSIKHFQKALEKIRPSVSEKDRKHYESMKKLFSAMKP